MLPRTESISFRGIYAIRHVASGKMYIGSAKDIGKRWSVHRAELKRGTHHSRYLQRAWDKYGPDAFVWEALERVEDNADLVRVEQEHLDHFRSWLPRIGYNVNPTAGSCLGMKHSSETIRKMSERARNRSPEHLAKIGEASRNRSPESRAKTANSLRNNPQVIAQLARMNENRTVSEEHRAKIAKTLRGRVFSPEHRAKLAEAARNISAEHRAKLGEANRRRIISEETRAKMSRSQKARFESSSDHPLRKPPADGNQLLLF